MHRDQHNREENGANPGLVPGALRISIGMRPNYQNGSGAFNGNGGSRAQLRNHCASKSMAMVSIYHNASYVDRACASAISTKRHALKGHCVRARGVALDRPMACPSYAHSICIYLRVRGLQPEVHFRRAITEHMNALWRACAVAIEARHWQGTSQLSRKTSFFYLGPDFPHSWLFPAHS